MKAIPVLVLLLSVSPVSAQTSVKVVHEYYDSVYQQFNAGVVKVLQLVRGKETPKSFSYKRAANGNKLTIEYQCYEDSRIISVQITGRARDVVKLYTALYNRKVKKSAIINDEWVRIQTDDQTKEGKIIIQAIIY